MTEFVKQRAVLDRARQIWMDDPGLTIDDVARFLAGERLGWIPDKGSLSRTRMEVRQKISAAGGVIVPVPPVVHRNGNGHASRVEPFNPIKLPAREEIAMPKVVEKTEDPDPKAWGPAERRRWLEGWCLEHPDTNYRQADAALQEKCGKGLTFGEIGQVIRLARSAAGLPPPRPGPRPKQSVVREKIAWAKDWLRTHTFAGPTELGRAIHKQFGAGMANTTIGSLVRAQVRRNKQTMADNTAKQEPRGAGPDPVESSGTIDLAALVKLGVTEIKIDPDGTVRFSGAMKKGGA